MGSRPSRTAGPLASPPEAGRTRRPLSRLGIVGAVPVVLAVLAVLVLLVGSATGPLAAVRAPAGPPRADTSCAGVPSSGCSTPPQLASAPSPTSVRWSNLSQVLSASPAARADAAVAFDPTLGAIVLFGGRSADGTGLSDMWTFATDSWGRLAPDAIAPSPRWGAAMAYDDRTGSLILFGGQSGGATLGDTWALNASGWHELEPLVAPSARSLAVLAYDPVFGGVLLFGGAGPTGAGLNDTWIFSGATWTNLSHGLGGPPPARLRAAAAYDGGLGALVVYGGTPRAAATSALADTWSLGAGGWQNLTASAGRLGPGPREGASAAMVDPLGGVVVTGGVPVGTRAGVPPAGTWVFEGGGWQDATPRVGTGPSSRVGAVFAYDPTAGQALLFGGAAPAEVLGDTWSLGSSALAIAVTVGPTAGAVPLTSDFSVVCSGGTPPYAANWSFGDGAAANGSLNTTHVYAVVGNYTATVTVEDAAGDLSIRSVPIEVLTAWQGGHQWANVGIGLPAVPSPRHNAQLAYDPGLAAALLFGGESASGAALGDTWEFVNNVWINLTSGTGASPPPRWGGTLVADPIDGTMLLFGGVSGQRSLNDTWTYNGSGWTETSGSSPSPRAFAQAAFDSYDGYVVLFGGTSPGPSGSAGAIDADTWEYRGGVWRNITSQLAIAPPPTTGGVAVYDPADSVTVLFGGSSVAAGGAPGTCYPNGATWQYVGGAWTAAATSEAPPGELQPAATYDAKDRMLLLFGGSATAGAGCAVSATTWSYLGGSWTNLTGPSVGAPPGRDGASMTFDAAEDVVLLFGGSAAGLMLNDTWVFPTEITSSSTTVTGNGTSPQGGSGSSGGSGGSTGGTGSGGGDAIPFAVGYTLSSAGGTGPLTITFTASYVGGAPPVSFSWYFGDSTPTVNGSVVSHEYTLPGSYDPVLTATDGRGEVVIRVLATIQVAGNAPPVLTSTPVTGTGVAPIAIAAVVLTLGAAVVAATALILRRQELSDLRQRGGGRNA